MPLFELNMQSSPSPYLQELSDLATEIPAYEELKTFAETSQTVDASPPQISVVHFNDSAAPDFLDIAEGDLLKYLEGSQVGSVLFIIENINTSLMDFLGSRFGVEFDFWLDHVSDSNWFRLEEIEKHLPALKSVQLGSKYIRHRFISPRELLLNTPGRLVDDRIEPEAGSARVFRVAGALNPLERLPHRSHMKVRSKERFQPLALTRHHVSMWFDSEEGSNGWKTGMLRSQMPYEPQLVLIYPGIILVDPPFQPQKVLGTCQKPSYRSFLKRLEPDTGLSYHTSFISCLKQDEILRKGGIPCPFVTLRNIYRIIASEWVVVNTCFQRELNTIEWNLENEENPRLNRFHEHLNSLYIIRRRITLYEMLIKEQREACRHHGRKYWNHPTCASGTANLEAVENVVSTLETDFAFVENLVEKNQERVTKNIGVLIALVSIAESHIGVANGKRIEVLTLVAIFFLPFSIVSSVMNINGDLGPGRPRQYVFWLVSVTFSSVLGLVYMAYCRWRIL